MRIKKANKREIKEVAKLLLAEFRKPPFKERASLNSALNSLNFYFKIGKIYVAVIKKEIVGVLVFKMEQHWEGPVIIIEDLAVKEKFKKQGVGKSLMGHVENYAKKNKIKRILFQTHKKSSALKFYKKIGYKSRTDLINFGKKIK